MSLRIDVGTEPSAARDRGITSAAAAIKRGEVVVMPTESMYAFAADAFSARAVAAIREMKARGPAFPIGVLVGSVRTVDGLAAGVGVEGRALMEAFWPGPLTLVVRAQPTLAWDLGGTDGTVSVRMPLHPVALDLLAHTGPLAVTGANRAGTAPPRSCEAVVEDFADVSVVLDAGHCVAEQPSTVLDLTGDTPLVLREGAFRLEDLQQVCPTLEMSP